MITACAGRIFSICANFCAFPPTKFRIPCPYGRLQKPKVELRDKVIAVAHKQGGISKKRKPDHLMIGGQHVSRSAFRFENAVEKTWLHGDCSPDIGAWHRREHRDFQRGERSPVATGAVSECRRTGRNQQDAGRRSEMVVLAAGLFGLEAPEYRLYRHRGVQPEGVAREPD